MILSALAAIAVTQAPNQAPIQLARVFKKGETMEYSVNSNLHVERRQYQLQTWIPEDLDLNYKFTAAVTNLKADGVAEILYSRPTMTEITGETFDKPPQTKVEKLNWKMKLSVSPVNEVLNLEDLTPKPKAKSGSGNWTVGRAEDGTQQIPFIGQFIGEVYRLSLFVGSLDSALDFAPRFDFRKVKPGDSWKRTVSYSPQKLKGKDGKTVVQRLDYTYTYKGLMTVNKKQIHRVVADLKLDTNLADFVNETFNAKPEETGLKSIPLNLVAKIEFDLEPNTFRTLQAVGTSEGGFKIMITDLPNDALQEEKIRGRTTMRLLKVTGGK